MTLYGTSIQLGQKELFLYYKENLIYKSRAVKFLILSTVHKYIQDKILKLTLVKF